MTVSEIQIAIKQGIDKTSSLTFPSFLPEELDYWYNKVQDDFVDALYKEIIEGKSTLTTEEYISPLLTNTTITLTIDTGKYNGKLYRGRLHNHDLTDSTGNPLYKYLLSVTTYGNRVLEDGTTVVNKFMNCMKINPSDGIAPYITTTYNVPYFEEPVYFLGRDDADAQNADTYISIIVDAFTSSITSSEIIFVRKPVAISSSTGVTSILPDMAIRKIIDLTVMAIIENIQNKQTENNKAPIIVR
jgi:hypothetical protein